MLNVSKNLSHLIDRLRGLSRCGKSKLFSVFFFLYWILEYDDPGPNKYSGFTTLWTSVIVIIILSLVKEYFAITFHNYKKPINVNLPMNSDTNSVTK